jgi:hypothetical protein
MPVPYRKAKGHAWMWLLLIFGSIAFSIVLGFQFPKDIGWIALPIFGLPILATIIICAIIQARIDKSRRMKIIEFLRSLKFDASIADDRTVAAAFFTSLAHLETSATLRGGANNIQWFATGEIAGQPMVAFEHEYITGSGRSTQVHTSTCVAFPSDKGGVTFMRPRFGEARVYRKNDMAFKLENEEFDSRWVIWGEKKFADAFFSQELMIALRNSPSGEWWCIGGGWECCLTRNALDGENLGRFISHANSIAKVI